MTVEIKWSAYFKDDPEVEAFAREHVSILESWRALAPNGPSTAERICEDFFNDPMWLEYFGSEDTHATIYLDILTPSSIAGRYRVELERRTKAAAHKMLPVFVAAE